jgi:hypothetical protein
MFVSVNACHVAATARLTLNNGGPRALMKLNMGESMAGFADL